MKKEKTQRTIKLVLNEEKPIIVTKKTSQDVDIHMHNYFEFELVLSGSGEHFFNGKTYPIKRGSVFFSTPADCHSIKIKDEILLWNISFHRTVLTDNLITRIYQANNSQKQVDESTLNKLVMCAKLLKKEMNKVGRGNIKSLMEYTLSLIFTDSAPRKMDSLENALILARTHFRESPTVEEASKVACLSPVYFGNVFKKTYGMSFNEYVNAQKVECAKLLLSNGMSVAQACFESGFNSLSNFLKVFKAFTGVVPKDYKKGSGTNI